MDSKVRGHLNKANDCGSKFVKVNFTNHHAVLVEGLWNLFRSKRLLDFDLQLGQGQSVSAHRTVLEVFLSPDKLDGVHQDSMDLTVDPDDDQHLGIRHQLDYLVELLYRGEVEVPEERLEDLSEAARELNLEILVDAVEAARCGSGISDLTTISPLTLWQRKGNPINCLSAQERISGRRLNCDVHESPSPPAEPAKPTEGLVEAEQDVSDCETSLPLSPSTSSSSTAPSESVEPSISDDTSAALVGELTAVYGDAVRQCTHCEYQTKNERYFELHVADHDLESEMFWCRTCRRRFPDEGAMEHHICKQRVPRKSYDCAQCDHKCLSRREYDAHMIRHDQMSTTKCELCDRHFPSLNKMKRHKLAKHKVFKCPHCPYEGQKRWCYYHHLNAVHQVNSKGEPVEKKHCLHCSYTCMTKTELHYHTVARHGGVRPFKCTLCDYTVGRQADLNRHVKVIHLGIKPHLCETCGFRTDTLSKLEAHSVVHTGEKKFSCNTCNQVFSNRSSLKLHERRHESDEKPYVCHVCGNAFTRPFNLTVHLKNVHKIRMDAKAKK